MPDGTPGKNTYLSIMVAGDMDAGRMENLYALILQSGCSIKASRTLGMGQLCGTMMQLGGNWDNVVRCEDLLARMADELDLKLQMARTKVEPVRGHTMSYAIDLIAPDSPGIMYNVMKFINQQGVKIRDIQTSSHAVHDSDTAIFTLHATVRTPDTMSIGSFRADFSDLCDHLNLDAVVEPIKPYE